MDALGNLLALTLCAGVGGAILGVGMAFGLRVSGADGWPIIPIFLIAVAAFAFAAISLKG